MIFNSKKKKKNINLVICQLAYHLYYNIFIKLKEIKNNNNFEKNI